jgi:hypothetical protein
MLRCLSITVLLASLFAASSCSVSEWGPHSVCRAWADYNTLMTPGFYLERDDHLPYPATQVGYYRWMYDKDPGHQYACLGTVPPRTCVKCDPVPPGDQPFEYEVVFPAGVPKPSDDLWGNKLPEPVNVPAPAHAGLRQNLGPPLGNSPPAKVPDSTLPPPPDSAHTTIGRLPAADGTDPQDDAMAPKRPARLPSFDPPPPPVPKPIDDNPAPLLGPAAQQGPNLRLTTGQPIPSNVETAPSPDSVWPR